VPLSRGRVAVIRQATGDDSIQALKSAPADASSVEQYYALTARCVAIDGVQMTYDTFRRLPLGVITRISKVFQKLNEDDSPMEAPEPQAAPSSGV
jgi:hypothetical protein